MLVVFSVTGRGPRLGCSERPRDPLNQSPSLVLRIDIPHPCSHFTCKPSECRAARPALRVELLFPPSITVGFLSRRSVSCSCSQWRRPGSVMTESPARLVEGSPSFVATELATSPQHRSRALAIPQPAVENAIRRRICQYLHGFSCAAPLP